MNICIYILHNNDANENNAQVFSADKIFVEVVVMSCPSRVATRGNGGKLHIDCHSCMGVSCMGVSCMGVSCMGVSCMGVSCMGVSCMGVY